MPNGRSDGFMMRKEELVRLLGECKEAMLKTRFPPAPGFQTKTRPAADLIEIMFLHPDEKIFVEEIDFCIYRILLGADQDTWIYVEARHREEDSPEESLFSHLREYHLIRSMEAADSRRRGKIDDLQYVPPE